MPLFSLFALCDDSRVQHQLYPTDLARGMASFHLVPSEEADGTQLLILLCYSTIAQSNATTIVHGRAEWTK